MTNNRTWKKIALIISRITSHVHPRPVFVLGNQKSGTTAVAALLSVATGLSATLDLMAEIVRPRYPEVLRGELGFPAFVRHHKLYFARPIVKDPNLTLLYSHLRSFFPGAQFVFVVRDPRDNIRSILDRLNLPGNLSDLTQQQRSTISKAWSLILDSGWLGFPDGSYVQMLASRWNIMADVLLRHRDSMVLIRYEDFLNDKCGSIGQLATQLGLRTVEDISNKIDLQFQPRGRNRDLDWLTFFGKENLRRIEQTCSSRMHQLGYVM